jgi:predicted dehydrogenase
MIRSLKVKAYMLNILVVGAGMYVCGKGTDGYGTIMPAICEWSRMNGAVNVCIACSSGAGAGIARKKVSELMRLMGVRLPVTYLPAGRAVDRFAYMKAIGRIGKQACAIIAVPDSIHSKVAGDTIRAGLHTLVVKPLAPTLKEVHGLICLQDRKNVYCAVEFHKRLDEANIMLKESLRDGAVGEPLYFLAEFSQRKIVPLEHFKRWVRDTNIFQYLGIHYVDIVYFATGAMPLRAMATGQKGWLSANGMDTYDSVCAVIEWRSRSGSTFTSHIMTNWVDPESTSAMSDQKIKVIGTLGRFESDQKCRGVKVVTDRNGIEEPNPYFSKPYGEKGDVVYSGYGIKSVGRFLNDVLSIERGLVTIEELEAFRPTFRRSVVPTAVLEAVNESLRKGGRWVVIKDVEKGLRT